MHSYNKCKDLDHLFIICGAVHASCISRNRIKALSIHVNHKTFQESKTLFFLICKRTPLRMIFSCTANRKPELCTYTPITYTVLKKQYNSTDSKEIKTMFHSILCRFWSTCLNIDWQISKCDFCFFPNVTAENHPPTKRN